MQSGSSVKCKYPEGPRGMLHDLIDGIDHPAVKSTVSVQVGYVRLR